MRVQIAILKSILKYGFIYCLIFVFSTGGCMGGDSVKSKGESDANCKKDSKKGKSKSKTTPTPSNLKKPVVQTANGNSNDQDDDKLSLDQDSEREKEGVKENIEEKIKNSSTSTEEIALICNKIENLSKAKEICDNHRKVFLKILGHNIRVYWYSQLCSYLDRAGLTPTEIEQVQSKKDIVSLLEEVNNELLFKLGLPTK